MADGLTFEIWMAYLRDDCRQKHKLLICDGNDFLQVLWSMGVEPTVQAIVDQADSVSYLPMAELANVKLGRSPH
jgi:hypothetical protein